ncbi:MAG: hypothetical protein GF330_11130 [Candidatus Eisenbacteria bacterium]|nr:hypothetical protein [Candidatus Eisenbacteria bacterium]
MRHARLFGPFLASLAALALVAAATFPPAAAGAELRQTLTFSEPSWTPAAIGGDFATPTIPGARTIGHPGEPELPVHTARILLPPGAELVRVRVAATSPIERAAHLPAPAQREYPLSFEGPIPPVAPRAEIYASDALFPPEPLEPATVQIYRGHRIAFVNLFPLRARPASGTVEFTREMTIEITTAPSAAALAQSARTYRADAAGEPATDAWLARNVLNPELREAYRQAHAAGELQAPPGGPFPSIVDPADTFLYVILTNATMSPAYEPLRDAWTERGLPATIVDVADVLATYDGRDDQERIRNFILDAYQNWESDYVLFGGDINVIPDRDCYCYVIDEGTPIETNDLCCELYYQGLDATWNDDGDNRWGEEGEEDLLPDIHIARTCTDNATQVEGVVQKALRYAYEPVTGEIESAVFFGEYLWTDTWGGMYMEEIRLGADSWGYETAGLPPGWIQPTHYEMDGDSWSGNTYKNEMNGGKHMAHHLGHSDYTYNMKIWNSDVPDFTNDGLTHNFCLGYTQGCNAGGFDTNDCILEEFAKSPTGFVAWVGNTRYGFGVHYTTNGSSQYYHRQFADALWGEAINELAAANNDSRTDNVGYIDYESNRWVHYEITAFGDPALPIWTRAPRTPTLDHAGVFVLGTTSYDVTIRAGGQPVDGARVCAWDELGEAYAFGVTDPFGQVTLELAPGYPGTLHLVVSDADLLVTEETVPIIPIGPYMVVESHTISDATGGNGDGDCDAGEAIELFVELTNIWDEPITGVGATIACPSEHVAITDDTAWYGDFAGGETQGGEGGDHFAFEIAGGCPDQETLVFAVTIEDDTESQWDGELLYGVEAPSLQIAWRDLDDAAGGDGDGVLEPGESATVTITLANSGGEDAIAVGATFATESGWLTITQSEAAAGDIPPGTEASLLPPFEVGLDPGAPSPWMIHCTLDVTGDWSLSTLLPVDLPVGGLRDDMEAGEGDWTHEIVTPGFADDWHHSSERNHTPGGGWSWKYGDAGTGDYSNLSDGALVSAPIPILENTVLTLWHWMEAEVSGAYPGYCYDGGRVEMSLDGGVWEPITPEGGYPYLVREGSTPGPFPAETPVFSGTHDWQPARFSISSGGGMGQFRFRFGSDGADTREGWHIDDVEIVSWSDASEAEAAQPLALRPILEPSRPNPFAADGAGATIRFVLPRAGSARLQICDLQGRVVRTLCNEHRGAGAHGVVWDGRDDRGRALSAGIYLYRLELPDVFLSRKLTMLR